MILFTFSICGKDNFLSCTISKFVKPDIQTFADNVRLILLILGDIVATASITFADKRF